LPVSFDPPSLVSWLEGWLNIPRNREEGSKPGLLRLKEAIKSLSWHLKFSDFTESPALTVQKIREEVCGTCSLHKLRWEMEGDETLALVQNLLGAEGLKTRTELPEWFRSRCPRSRQFLAFSRTFLVPEERYYPQGALKDWLASTLDHLVCLMEREPLSPQGTDPPWAVQLGAAYMVRFRSNFSGDSFAAFSLEEGKQVPVLTDGMGAGKEAHTISTAAVELIGNLLSAGFAPEMALKTLNMILYLKNFPKEIFTSCDLCIIDAVARRASFYKCGACSTFIKRKGKIKTVSPTSPFLPLGTVEDFCIEGLEEDLEEGDILVMVSDGVLEAHGEIEEKGRWV